MTLHETSSNKQLKGTKRIKKYLKIRPLEFKVLVRIETDSKYFVNISHSPEYYWVQFDVIFALNTKSLTSKKK